jgi:hypothetical protein
MDSYIVQLLLCEVSWKNLNVYMLNFLAQIWTCTVYVPLRASSSWTEFIASSGRAHFLGPKLQRASPSWARFSPAKMRLTPSPARVGSCPPLDTSTLLPFPLYNMWVYLVLDPHVKWVMGISVLESVIMLATHPSFLVCFSILYCLNVLNCMSKFFICFNIWVHHDEIFKTRSNLDTFWNFWSLNLKL